MCHRLSSIQRLTPARTLPGPDLSEGKTRIAACPAVCRDYPLTFPKLHIRAIHRAYLDHKLPPCPHHTTWLCTVSQLQVKSCNITAKVTPSSTQSI